MLLQQTEAAIFTAWQYLQRGNKYLATGQVDEEGQKMVSPEEWPARLEGIKAPYNRIPN
jgi:hypothetical protein